MVEGKAVVRVGSVEVLLVKLERGGVGEGVGKGLVGSGVLAAVVEVQGVPTGFGRLNWAKQP